MEWGHDVLPVARPCSWLARYEACAGKVVMRLSMGNSDQLASYFEAYQKGEDGVRSAMEMGNNHALRLADRFGERRSSKYRRCHK